MNRKTAALFLFLPLVSLSSVFNEYADKITTGTYSFENPDPLKGWNAVNGSVGISSKRAKVGDVSALWAWEQGGGLILENPKGLKEACEPYDGGSPEKYERKYVKPGLEGGVKLWVYNEVPSDSQLFLQVGHDTDSVIINPRYRIPVNLNFKGWRAIWVHFEQDARVEGYAGPEEMNCMALVPGAGTSGALYIDWVNFVSYMSLKRHSDWQVTNNKPTEERYDSYVVLEYDQGLRNLKTASFGEQQKSAFQTLEERYEFLVLGSEQGRSPWLQKFNAQLEKKYRTAHKTFQGLGISQKDGVLNGEPLFAIRDEHALEGSPIYQNLGAPLLFPLALEYRLTGNPKALDQLMTALDYLADQGWAAGSALGTADHRIRVNGYANAVALIRQELEESGRLGRESESLKWFSMLGAAFCTPEGEGVNTDLIRGGAIPKLLAVMLMPDGSEKAGAMSGLVDYFNQVCAFAPGYSDTIKPDYSLYHHRSAYQSAYGVSMLTTMTLIDWMLDGTVYQLSAESKTNLREALKAQLAMASKYDLHPGVSGRIQTRRALNTHLLPAYAFMAGLEGEFKRLYEPKWNTLGMPGLTYSGTLGTVEQMARRAGLDVEGVGAPDGHFTFPYAAYSTHRRDGWMAAVRGWSQYVWDFESGSKSENDLGRYLSHGALFIISEEGFVKSAQDLDTGYHWGFLPGATTKALPVEETVFKYVATPKYLECKHRNYTDETFCGGVNMAGNGFFSMKLHDTVAPDDERILFDDSFRATKSYFFVDDRIYCLGTGIENTDERFSTATTLFQNTTDFEPQLNDGLIRDATGNAYVLIGNPEIEIFRGDQNSYGKGRKPCSGPNVRAWINHGKAPSDASYEYMVAVNGASPSVPFEVLQKDSTAHIIDHRSSVRPITAYAVFEPENFKGQGVIAAVDTPLLLMSATNSAALKLAVADPDLRLKKWGHNMSFMPREIVQAEAEPHTASITLAGEWKLQQAVDGVEIIPGGGQTGVRIELQHGLAEELLFVRD
ncbi:chondroitinase family polysaccharide lyase [Tichowtungia aerotolerans]|uniref:Uncharacterized protein n=1 Tax=Tichowtungia aerotolerans TaxID=2697043 RepID=A0A6P1M8D8_9BACT|nr:chondroitinase family polysaccharide lyase [Tichowtungia aerotolerans]QHI69323.1 hypothetical protein GT409_07615 [Tichowtungia aerotolerans]